MYHYKNRQRGRKIFNDFNNAIIVFKRIRDGKIEIEEARKSNQV